MPYSLTTLGSMVTELSLRLYDPAMQFWSQAELIQRIQDALRMWNLLTAQNQQWYSLPVADGGNAPWYDLQVIANSPRTATLDDSDLYSRMQYHLLEDQVPDAGVLTNQFASAMFVNAAQGKRDEFLIRTGSVRTVEKLNITPNNSTLSLPGAVIQVERAYWLPASGGNPYPLYRSDQYARTGYGAAVANSPADPQVYSTGIEPPLTMEMTPAPANPGAVEMLTVETQAALSALSTTTLYVPQDCVPSLAWGAIADLLNSNAEAQDVTRAKYADMRFEQMCEFMAVYPFVLGARVGGIDTFVCSVEALDQYNPAWRTPVAQQLVVAFAGQNLICFPTTTTQNIAILVNGSAQLPSVAGDYVQIGNEFIDPVLDLAQHEASFKMGGSDFTATLPLYQNFLRAAAKKNAILNALSSFKPWLYGELDSANKLFAPMSAGDDGEI